MKVKFDLSRGGLRECRRDKALFQSIMESLRAADRVGNRKCRELLVRALQEA